jgi:hypothetical protein
MYLTPLLTGIGLAAAASVAAWMLMESWFRSRLLLMAAGPASQNPGSSRSSRFMIFLASGIARTTILAVGAFFALLISIGPYLTTPPGSWDAIGDETRAAAIIGLLIFAGLAFLLTVADTLIRSNAVHLLGSHMLEVAGVIGTLLFLEAAVAVCGVIAVLAAMLRASSLIHFMAALALTLSWTFLLSTLHSYLLLVRYFSIDIMKRDVIDV